MRVPGHKPIDGRNDEGDGGWYGRRGQVKCPGDQGPVGYVRPDDPLHQGDHGEDSEPSEECTTVHRWWR